MIILVFFTEENAKISSELNAVKFVCLALKNHLKSAEVAEAAAAAMVSLCLDGRLKINSISSELSQTLGTLLLKCTI